MRIIQYSKKILHVLIKYCFFGFCIFIITLVSSCSTKHNKVTNKYNSQLFEAKIKLDNKKISPKESINLIDIESDDKEVDPNSKKYLSDENLGIGITVKNNTDKYLSYRKCDIQDITFTKNITLPGKVKIGMSAKQVFNAKTGIYGKPDNFSGSLLYGTGLDKTYAIYKKGHTSIHFCIDSTNNTIYSVTYKYTTK